MYFLPEHRDMGLLCFQAGHLYEWTDFSSAPIFTDSHYPKQGLWQTGAGVDLLPALKSKIINLNGSIWSKCKNQKYLKFSPSISLALAVLL